MKRRFLELIYIKWVDIEVDSGWDTMEDALLPLEEIHSVGYLVAQDLDTYVLAADYDPELETFNRTMKIPRSNVRRLRTVTIIPLKIPSP